MFDALGRITELREARGYSVYRLAKESGIPQSTFMTWYSQNRYPSIDKIEAICDTLGITLPEFFSDTDQLETGRISSELTELNSKYLLLTPYQKNAIITTIDAFLHK